MRSSLLYPVFCVLSAGGLLYAASSSPEGPASRPATQPAAQAVVDPRVELMSIIFRLAGNSEYNMPVSKSPYADEVEKQFGPFREHPVVQKARELHGSRGISYDAVMNMAVHLTDAVGLKERIPLHKPGTGLDSRWTVTEARDFLSKSRSFVKDAKFAEFIEQHREFYAAASARFGEALGTESLKGWFDAYFGRKSPVEFHVIVGLLNGGGCYGPSLKSAGGPTDMYAIIGAWKFDGKGLPIWESDIIDTVVHEYCHSYTNPLVEAHLNEMRKAADKIHRTCAAQMSRQAYGTAETLLYESMVRACTVRYLRVNVGRLAGWKAEKAEAGRGFVWVGDLAKLLEQYEKDRKTYPNLEAFMPKVVDFFNQYAAKLPAVSATAQDAPKIVSMVPANGATDVDPALTEIKVTFDQPMLDHNWAVVGGGPHFPDTPEPPHYDKARKVLTLRVRLKPSWSYDLWLNRGEYNSFRSDTGVQLEPVHVTFTTRSAE